MDSAPTSPTNRPPEVEDAIRCRAEKLYEERGKTPGHQVEDWLRAEAEVIGEIKLPPSPKPAFLVVRMEGVTYTGEYDAMRCDGYAPGEFRSGAPVEVRLYVDKMFVKRPNGRELETRIVRKEIGR